MNSPTRHVATMVFVAFAVLVGGVTWNQVIRGPDFRDDARNVRVIEARTTRERGTIITGDGTVVAESIPDPADPRDFRRVYPHGSDYAHVVGYSSTLFGATGLEESEGADLVSNRDATISGVLDGLLGGDLRPRGLRLTLDHELQSAASAALGDQKGAIVAIDPGTGAVLAMVSKPDFDPNDLVDINAGPTGAALEADPDEPLKSRAISETFAPGSTFKMVTTAAALETGAASGGTTFPDESELVLPGSTATISNFDGEPCTPRPEVTLRDAFIRSCNTVFGRLGLELGAEPLVGAAEAFGFNQQIPLELEVLASRIPPAETFDNDLPGVAQSAIGQRDVRATPLQMAIVAAGVANGGEIMVPHLVDEVFTSDAEVVARTEPEIWRRALSPSTAATLTELMEQVVTSGTGRRAAVPGVRVAGKTGTAEVPGEAPHVWFAGFGPVDDPEIAIVVLIESGGDLGEGATGGTVAAPIAQELLELYLTR